MTIIIKCFLNTFFVLECDKSKASILTSLGLRKASVSYFATVLEEFDKVFLSAAVWKPFDNDSIFTESFESCIELILRQIWIENRV